MEDRFSIRENHLPSCQDPNQAESRAEGNTLGLDFVAKGCQKLPRQGLQEESFLLVLLVTVYC